MLQEYSYSKPATMAFSVGWGPSNLNSEDEENEVLKQSGLNGDMFFWIHSHFEPKGDVRLPLYEKTDKGFQTATIEFEDATHELWFRAFVWYNGKRRTSISMKGYIYGTQYGATDQHRTGYIMGLDELVEPIQEYDTAQLDKRMAEIVFDRYEGYPIRQKTYLWKTPRWIPLQSHPRYFFDSFSVIRGIHAQQPDLIDLPYHELRDEIERVEKGESSESETEQKEQKPKKSRNKKRNAALERLAAASKRLKMKRRASEALDDRQVKRQNDELNYEDAELI